MGVSGSEVIAACDCIERDCSTVSHSMRRIKPMRSAPAAPTLALPRKRRRGLCSVPAQRGAAFAPSPAQRGKVGMGVSGSEVVAACDCIERDCPTVSHSMRRIKPMRSAPAAPTLALPRKRRRGFFQNRAVNSNPYVRGSLMKPVRLLKSMPPTMRVWSVMLRPNTATSYLPTSQL